MLSFIEVESDLIETGRLNLVEGQFLGISMDILNGLRDRNMTVSGGCQGSP